jgi:hypothetical protein
MWVQLRREISREKFDDATILFLFECRAEHLPVLGTSGLVLASDYRDFFSYKLSRGGSSEVPIVVGAIPDRGDIPLDGFWVFVVAECSVYGLLPGVCERPDVVDCM